MPIATALRKPGQTPHPNLAAIAQAAAQAKDEKIASFLSYYRSIHPLDRLPSRSDFDPMAVPRLLPNLVLVEVEREPTLAFRIKVAGDEILTALRIPLQGRSLDDIMRQDEPSAEELINARLPVLHTGLLVYYRGPPRMRFSLDFADLEYVHCPLAEDGRTVSHIVSVLHYDGSTRAS